MCSDLTNKLQFAENIDFSEILTNPILDIAARFWDNDRYAAFRVCYRSMRIIDDLVDDRRATGEALTDQEQTRYIAMLTDWLEAFKKGRADFPFVTELREIVDRFAMPTWPWERLATAMIYDLSHTSFPSFRAFRRYTEGAAIAPASVFMHLCGVRSESDRFRPPTFDICQAARPLALFSYLVHIIRDFEKDQKSNLNYYADSILQSLDLTLSDLKTAATDGKIEPPLRRLIFTYRRFAEYYRQRARIAVDTVAPLMPPRYALSLEIIYSLYLQIFERIDPEEGKFTTSELNPLPDEVKNRIEVTISAFHS